MGLKKLDSEYKSSYKTLPVHRPVMVKAKLESQPLDCAPEALESSRRAGLLSNQLGSVSEPPLQRKRIVPYQHNHNIFETRTVKELDDKQWIEAVGSDTESSRNSGQAKTPKVDNKARSSKKDTEYTSHYVNDSPKKESPVIAAAAAKTRMIRKYNEERAKEHKTSRKSQGASPDRLPPAGRPTYISDPRDKRLLRPSDSSSYLTFPDYGHPRKSGTEYSERYENATTTNDNKTISKPKPEQTSFIDEATYRKVLEQRNSAYGMLTSPSKASLVTNIPTTPHAQDTPCVKQSEKSRRHSEDERHNRRERDARKTRKTKRHDRKHAGEVREQSPDQTSVRLTPDRKPTSSKKEHIPLSNEEQRVKKDKREQKSSKRSRQSRKQVWHDKTPRVNGLDSSRGTPREHMERGRSPTPELRQAGQSRRHHLDVTTGSNNPLASSVDPYKTRVLSKMADLDIRGRRLSGEYDPSRYSDAGDTMTYTSSLSSWTDRDSVGSRSLTTTDRSSKRSI